MTSTVPTKPDRPWEALELKSIVEDYILNDDKFKGLARYIVNVRIFWSYDIPTACAGHGFIFFNPDFYQSIPEESRRTVFAHEIWHLILRHLDRGKKCDPYIHNIAADYVINIALKDDGFTFEGTDPYLDDKWRSLSTEHVYNKIYEEKKKANTPPNLKDLAKHIPAEKIEDLIKQVVHEEGKDLKHQKEKAEEQLEQLMDKPSGLETGNQLRLLTLSREIIPIEEAEYKDIFKKYLIDPLSGGKRTFTRPNRRQHGMMKSSLVLPGRSQRKGHYNRLTHLTYALDISGSITAEMANQFHNSVRSIKELLNPELLTVLFFDTKVKHQQTFTDKQPYTNIRVQAGGSTDLKDVYRLMSSLNSEALVIFTDLKVRIPPEPSWDTIWLVPKRGLTTQHVKYGKIYLIS